MGVKDLWPLLASVKVDCSLSVLRGKSLAVDLSGWICQAQTAKGLRDSVQKPHLRNLFFRVTCLYEKGVALVVVVDGEATPLKWSAMDQRENRTGGGARRTGRRTQLDNKMRECCELLDAMGVPCLQSKGEAEALCAQLNMAGLVDGVLTEDSDAFLYGACTVYRDLSTNEKNSRVSVYSADAIQKQLGYSRRDFIGFALLLGCDFCPQGVPGVGKEGAVKLLRLCREREERGMGSCDLLTLFQVWVKDGVISDGDVLEQRAKTKALGVSGFPNDDIISEFLDPKDTLPPDSHFKQWKMPQLQTIQTLCSRLLEWPLSYTCQKCLPLLTQWATRHAASADTGVRSSCGMEACSDVQRGNYNCAIKPVCIIRTRVRHKEASYEVEWEGEESLLPLVENGESSPAGVTLLEDPVRVRFTTIETAMQFRKAFLSLCLEWERRAAERQATKIKGKKKSSKQKTVSHRSLKDVMATNFDDLSNAVQKLSLADTTSFSSTAHDAEENGNLRTNAFSKSLSWYKGSSQKETPGCLGDKSLSNDGECLDIRMRPKAGHKYTETNVISKSHDWPEHATSEARPQTGKKTSDNSYENSGSLSGSSSDEEIVPLFQRIKASHPARVAREDNPRTEIFRQESNITHKVDSSGDRQLDDRRQPDDRQPGDSQFGGRQPCDRQSGDGQPGDRQLFGDRLPGDRQFGGRQPCDRQSGDGQPGDRQLFGDRLPGNRQLFGDRLPGDRQSGDRQSGDRQTRDGQDTSKDRAIEDIAGRIPIEYGKKIASNDLVKSDCFASHFAVESIPSYHATSKAGRNCPSLSSVLTNRLCDASATSECACGDSAERPIVLD